MFKVRVQDERGMVAVTVALLLAALLGFAALALDISSLLLVRNELQNAADAGALAGAGELYLNSGEQINTGCNAVAEAAATTNSAQNNAVEVNANTGSNSGDVQRGHWRWTDHSFTPDDSLAAVVLNDVTNADLDANMNFINAVRVIARRQTTPAVSFFSHLLGFSDFQMQSEAIAYIGFAGTFSSGGGTRADCHLSGGSSQRGRRVLMQYGAHDKQLTGRRTQHRGVDQLHPGTL